MILWKRWISNEVDEESRVTDRCSEILRNDATIAWRSGWGNIPRAEAREPDRRVFFLHLALRSVLCLAGRYKCVGMRSCKILETISQDAVSVHSPKNCIFLQPTVQRYTRDIISVGVHISNRFAYRYVSLPMIHVSYESFLTCVY